MVEVKSSNIRAVDYNDGIIVEYLSGNKYKYKGTTKDLYEKFINSESKGKFLNSEIKNKFEYERIS